MRANHTLDARARVPLARQWLTTADAARMLAVSADGVIWLAKTGRLACERTVSGQRLFRLGDVVQLVAQRAHARLVGRPIVAHRSGEPRQLSLFGKARLRLVRATEDGSDSGSRDPEVGRAGRGKGERVLQEPVAKRLTMRPKMARVR